MQRPGTPKKLNCGKARRPTIIYSPNTSSSKRHSYMSVETSWCDKTSLYAAPHKIFGDSDFSVASPLEGLARSAMRQLIEIQSPFPDEGPYSCDSEERLISAFARTESVDDDGEPSPVDRYENDLYELYAPQNDEEPYEPLIDFDNQDNYSAEELSWSVLSIPGASKFGNLETVYTTQEFGCGDVGSANERSVHANPEPELEEWLANSSPIILFDSTGSLPVILSTSFKTNLISQT